MSSFNDMMQQAIKIRTSTDAKLRVDFDARPKFQQTSLYALPQVREARSMPLEKRLDACIAMKEDGNRQLQSGRPEEACHTYEQALAMFWYLDNQNEKWKTSGIKDEDIFEVNFTPSEEEVDQEQRIRNLKVALLLNISRAYSAQNDYGTSRRACTVALSLDPSSAKALYLRAKWLVCPASAGAFETEEAIRDLSRAAELAPSDRMVRALLSKLRAERTRQREIDRAAFAGMFSRGSVCGTSKSPESATESAHGLPQAGGHNSVVAGVKGDPVNHGDTQVAQPRAPGGEPDDKGAFPVGTRKEVEARLTFLERLASECDDEDREEDGKGYRERIKAVRDALAQHDADEEKRAAMMDPSSLRVDWRHPNQELRKRAEEDELDLDNPLVVNFLMKMEDAAQRKKARRGVETEQLAFPTGSLEPGVGKEGGGGVGGSWPNNSGTDEDEEWSKETCEGAIRCMSRTEVTSLLQDAAVVPEPGMMLRQLRDLAVKKLVEDVPAHGDDAKGGSTKRKTTAKKDTRRNAADWKISLVITLAIVLFKTYQMGLFSWIANGAIPRAAPGAPRFGHPIEDHRGTPKIPEMPFIPTSDHVDGHVVDSNTKPALSASSTNFPGQQVSPNNELSTDGGSDSKGLSGNDLTMMEKSADNQYYEEQAIEESEAEPAGNLGSTLTTEETNVENEF